MPQIRSPSLLARCAIATHLLMGLPLLAAAQPIPGAGDVVRDLPPPSPLKTLPAQPAPSGVPSSGAAIAPDVRFVLREVRFPPTRAVPEAEVFRAVTPYLKREIGSSDISAIAASIRRLYEDRGFGLVGIGFPRQVVSEGVLEIIIVEPNFGRIVVEPGSPPPHAESRTRAVIDYFGLRSGEPLNLLRLDRAMFTLNDWPGTAARASLTPTADEGTYNLAIQTERRRSWDASMDFDNYGGASSGRYRFGGLFRWNNPTGLGDNVDIRALVSNRNGVTVGRLGYEIPLGATPWRMGAGYTRVGYELGDAFAPLEARGSADVLDVSVSYPILRSRERNLIGRVALEDKRLEDRFDAVNVKTNKGIKSMQASLSFEARDALFGGGYTGGALGVQAGRLDIETPNAKADDAGLGDRATQGSFTKLSVQASRLQAMSRRLSAFVGLAGQWASKNLDNAEKLTLGGAKGVRAYPTAEGSSDEGVVLNAELRFWIDQRWTTFTFFDWGHGTLHKRPSPGAENTRVLRGAGLGLQFSGPESFNVKATLGWRGHEQVLSETDDERPRFLLQVQRPF